MTTFQGDDTFPSEDGFELTADLLDFFLWNCPTSMIPSHVDVRKWRATLAARGPEFASLVTECDEWLMPQEGTQGSGTACLQLGE